jgi:hypothetical protein
MHFHLPKPLHGWREFAGEVGVVLLGVLLALGAQQLVSDWQWRNEVRDAEQRMRTELSFDLALAYERFAIDPCLRPRLAELRDELMRNDPTWPGSRARFVNDYYKSGFPSVYRTPNRPWLQATWLTALDGGVIGHFNPDRVVELSGLFDSVAKLGQIQAEEADAGETLGDLAFAGPITPAERRANLKLVAKLDALDARMLAVSKVLINDSRAAGIGADRPSMKRLVDEQRAYRGPCVRDPGNIS